MMRIDDVANKPGCVSRFVGLFVWFKATAWVNIDMLKMPTKIKTSTFYGTKIRHNMALNKNDIMVQ